MKSKITWIFVAMILIVLAGIPAGYAQAQEGGGEEMSVRAAVLAAPVTESPGGDVWDEDDPEYTWTASSGAISYEIRVYLIGLLTPEVSRIVSSSVCTGGHCYYRSGVPLWNGNYKWMVRAKNSSGYSPWSAYRTFNIKSAALAGIWPSGNTTMVRPTFKWDRVNGALNYQLVVYSSTLGKTVLNTLVGKKYCGRSLCTYTPNLALSNGSFKWKVMGKGASQTTSYSVYKPFTVAKNGFNSEFNNSSTGWVKRAGGNWGFLSGSYFYTDGVANKASSINYGTTYSNFVYTIRMKRITSSSEWDPGGIYVRGNPATLDSGNSWKNGYLMGMVQRDGTFYVYQLVNGVARTLQPFTPSFYINKNDWNTLKVVANGVCLSYYINDHLVWSDTDTTFSSGYVGIGLYRNGMAASRGLIDWATLGVLPGGAGLRMEEFEVDEIDPVQAKLNVEAREKAVGQEDIEILP